MSFSHIHVDTQHVCGYQPTCGRVSVCGNVIFSYSCRHTYGACVGTIARAPVCGRVSVRGNVIFSLFMLTNNACVGTIACDPACGCVSVRSNVLFSYSCRPTAHASVAQLASQPACVLSILFGMCTCCLWLYVFHVVVNAHACVRACAVFRPVNASLTVRVSHTFMTHWTRQEVRHDAVLSSVTRVKYVWHFYEFIVGRLKVHTQVCVDPNSIMHISLTSHSALCDSVHACTACRFTIEMRPSFDGASVRHVKFRVCLCCASGHTASDTVSFSVSVWKRLCHGG